MLYEVTNYHIDCWAVIRSLLFSLHW